MGAVLIIVIILFGVVGHKYIESLILYFLKITKTYRVSISNGRELQSLLRPFFAQTSSSKKLPNYKFFAPFSLELRQLQLSHGLSSKSLLQCLRPWLTLDIQFEEKIQTLLKNSLLQFFILSAFTWIFYFNATSSLECELPWGYFSSLQVLGFLCFLLIFQHKRKRCFAGIDELSKRLLLFQSLKKVGLSIGEVLSRSKADQSLELSEENTRSLGEQLVKYSQSWVKSGRSIDEELAELSLELNYLREQTRLSFEKQLAVLRFVHLIGFYLFGYLLVVMGLIRQLALSY